MSLVQHIDDKLKKNLIHEEDDEESKFENEEEGEDPMLDEMLQKAEELRVAMLKVTKTDQQFTINHPSRPLLRKNSNRSISSPSQRSKVSVSRSSNGTHSMPAIPETIEMETDNATECSSVGYYSIVYGKQNNTSRTNINAPVVVLEEEEEKTNEDGSVHQAFFSDRQVSHHRHSNGYSTTIRSQQQEQDLSPKSSELMSPLAIAPDEDEIVSVKDYHKHRSTWNDFGNQDDVTWVKVAFVEQQDDDYASLQDYSREIKHSTKVTPMRRRKQRRKILTLGLVCVALVSAYVKLFRRYSATVSAPKLPVTKGPGTIKSPTLPASKHYQTAPSVSQSTISIQKEANDTATYEPSFKQKAFPSKKHGGVLRTILFPGQPHIRMIWEHELVHDRESIIQSFLDLLLE